MSSDREVRMRQLEDAVELFLAGGSTADGAPASGDPAVDDLLQSMQRPPQSEPALPSVGELHLVRELGRGGMGVVYEAVDPHLRRRVAVKLLRLAADTPASAVVRFRREAELAASLRHPSIVPIHSVGETEHAFYLVMELQRSATLAQVVDALRERTDGGSRVDRLPAGALVAAAARAAAQRFPEADHAATPTTGSTAIPPRPQPFVREAAALIADVAAGLGHAHAQSVVHRDVKPSNILVDGAGRARLTDFGLARNLEAPAITRTGDAPGTPNYMAPEQARGDRDAAAPAADVFALGTTLYELLTLQRAFPGATTTEVLLQVIGAEPPDVDRRNPAVPKDLLAIVQKAMQKAPQLRYPDAAAMAADLNAFLDNRPVTARPISRLQRLRRWAAREPWRALAAALVLVLAPLAIAFAVVSTQRDAETAAGRLALQEERLDRLLADGFREVGEGDVATARAAFEEILTFAPDSEEALAGLSVVARTRGPAAALAVLEERGRTRPLTPALRRRQASLLRELDRGDEAAHIERDLDADPVGFDAFLHGYRFIELGHRHREAAGSFAAAARMLHRAIVTTDHTPRLFYYEWLHAAAHARDADATDAAMAAVRRLWPEDAATWFWIAFARNEVGDVATAIDELRRAVAADPTFETAWFNLGRLLRTAGRAREALTLFRGRMAVAPVSGALLGEVAQSHFALGEARQAIDLFRRARALRPDDRDIRRGLAGALIDVGEFDEGAALAAELEQLDPDDPAPHWMLGAVSVQRGALPEGRRRFERFVALQPEARGFFTLGTVCGRLGDAAAAMTAYARAIELQPDHAMALTNLANLHLRAGERDAATPLLRRAIAADPDLVNARRALLRALENDPDAALAGLRDWVAHEPGFAEAWRHLGWQLVDGADGDGERLDEAMRCTQRALDLLPAPDGPTLHVLGAVQLARGDHAAARATLERALAALPPGDRFTPWYEERIRATLARCRDGGDSGGDAAADGGR
ncbi:MAG: protein kinase [Planctomycetota bacterium]